MTMTMSVSRNDIADTERLIRPFIRRTPTITVDAGDFGVVGLPIDLKLELMQHTGSFKARGAFANLLLREVPKTGVIAASGGNHGAAVAYAAQNRGVPATMHCPRYWWLVLDRREVDLCLKDPGFEVDLVVSADLRALIRVWMGDVRLAETVRAGLIRLEGPPSLVRAFPTWLKLSVLAGVERVGAEVAVRPASGAVRSLPVNSAR